MIHYIKGRLAMKHESGIVVEAGGIGYEIAAAGNSALYLASPGDEITVYTYLKVSEDDMSLFGFADEASLALFKRLITVNGVGAKAALAILSAAPTSVLIRAIILGDSAVLTKAQGVGKKSAERVILELKDKLTDLSAMAAASDEERESLIKAASGTALSGARADAIDALMALGYSRTEAGMAVASVREEGLEVSGYVRAALRQL